VKDKKSKVSKNANVLKKKVVVRSKKFMKKKAEYKNLKQTKGKSLSLAVSKKESKFKQGYVHPGVPGFDKLVSEGIPQGSAVLVEGGPGSGKTIFCLETAKRACEKGKKVLYMSFEEPEDRLKRHMESFGANVKEFEKKGLLYVKRFNALDIARSVEALLSEAKKELLIDVQPVLIPTDFEPDIVLFDSLSSIASAFSGEQSRFRIYMEQLFRYLEGHKMTSFLIREVASPTHVGTTFVETGEAVSFLSDGIIAIYNVFYKGGRRKRAIEVVKMRGVEINRTIVEYDILKGKGARVYPNKILKGDFILT
jgi:circadian clock protein KaiC